MSDWQPIETAPTDRAVLVCWFVGRVCQITTAMHSDGARTRGWWAWGQTPITPTHWMPLPAPPVRMPTEARL